MARKRCKANTQLKWSLLYAFFSPPRNRNIREFAGVLNECAAQLKCELHNKSHFNKAEISIYDFFLELTF